MKYRKAWTKGPWAVTDHDTITSPAGEMIADGGYFCHGANDTLADAPEWEANLHLSAAAPAMFEALDDLDRAAQEVHRLGAAPGPQWVKLTMALIKARSALLAADGQDALRPQGDTSDVG